MLPHWFDEPIVTYWLETAARRRIGPIVPLAVCSRDETSRAADVATCDHAPLLPPLDHEPAERLGARSGALDADG